MDYAVSKESLKKFRQSSSRERAKGAVLLQAFGVNMEYMLENEHRVLLRTFVRKSSTTQIFFHTFATVR